MSFQLIVAMGLFEVKFDQKQGAALVNCGLNFRDFDYLRAGKRGETARTEGNFINSSLK